jgi:cytochrome c oxidase assembly protein subunit 15
VVLSAWIRLAEVGIGCEDWPNCYAVLNADAEKRGITVLTAEGQEMAYRGVRLAHRYIASILGLFIVAIFAVATRQGAKRATGMGIPTAVFAVTVFLSLLGYYTPTRANPLITMGNLIGGMTLAGLLWWMMQRYATNAESTLPASLRPLAIATVILVAVQIILGGWASANYATSSCPDLFGCAQTWAEPSQFLSAYNPGRVIELDSAGRVIRENELGSLSMGHRLFAILTAGWLAWLVRRCRVYPQLKTTALAISVCSIGLIVVGVSSIWLQWPLPMVTLHNTLAVGLLLACINLLHHLSPRRAVLPPPG